MNNEELQPESEGKLHIRPNALFEAYQNRTAELDSQIVIGSAQLIQVKEELEMVKIELTELKRIIERNEEVDNSLTEDKAESED